MPQTLQTRQHRVSIRKEGPSVKLQGHEAESSQVWMLCSSLQMRASTLCGTKGCLIVWRNHNVGCIRSVPNLNNWPNFRFAVLSGHLSTLKKRANALRLSAATMMRQRHVAADGERCTLDKRQPPGEGRRQPGLGPPPLHRGRGVGWCRASQVTLDRPSVGQA